MAASVNDKLDQVTSSNTGRPVTAALAAPGHSIGGTSIGLNVATNWSTTTGIHFSIYATTTVGSLTVKDTTTQTDWKGTLSGTTISNMTITGGTDRDYAAGAIVEITPTAKWAKDLYDWAITEHNQNGTHSAITATSITATSGTFTNLTIAGTASGEGYSPLGATPDTITYNGNRSYDMVFNANDVTDTLSPGMRLKMTRTVTAPTQCADLESGSSQYFNKTSPAGTTFTDDFVVGAWIKVESYADMAIVSRYNGTSGWKFSLSATGRVQLVGYNASSANYSYVESAQSIPLGRWVHIAAQLDMSAFTATTTTSYVMIDGVDVPAAVTRAGTNPTALVQAGNLEVGGVNGGTTPFDGKLAQVFYSSAKITQANVRTLMSQGLTASLISTHSIVSAYSLSNAITDLNTTTANNLTAQGSAVATATDSPFAGGNVTEFTDGTTEFGIVTKTAFSTNTTLTVQVPEGYAIPTSGGVSAVSYSTHKVPYGFPSSRNKWELLSFYQVRITGSTSNDTYSSGSGAAAFSSLPVGDWDVEYNVPHYSDHGSGSAENRTHFLTLSTSSSAESDPYWTSASAVNSPSNPTFASLMVRSGGISLSTMTTHYILWKDSGGTALSNNQIFSNGSSTNASGFVKATCAYL